jgi:hypothetical protein
VAPPAALPACPAARTRPHPPAPAHTRPHPPAPRPQVNAAPARGPDHFPFQGVRDSGIGSQGIKNSLALMCKTKSTVINLDQESYTLA